MVNCSAALFTHNGVEGIGEWQAYQDWCRGQFGQWCGLYRSQTFEHCRNGRLHGHSMLQFRKKVNLPLTRFAFHGRMPNARPSWSDYLGENLNRKKAQQSYDRGFFYVWADKLGTCRDAHGALCVAGNYAPVWTDARFRYQVMGEWPETLWKKYQLSHEVYDLYILRSRDNYPRRKRNLDEVRQGEERSGFFKKRH